MVHKHATELITLSYDATARMIELNAVHVRAELNVRAIIDARAKVPAEHDPCGVRTWRVRVPTDIGMVERWEQRDTEVWVRRVFADNPRTEGPVNYTRRHHAHEHDRA